MLPPDNTHTTLESNGKGTHQTRKPFISITPLFNYFDGLVANMAADPEGDKREEIKKRR